VAQALEADPEDGLARPHEALVARHVGRGEPGHLRPHGGGVAGVVESLAVVETDAVERRDRPQLDIVGEPAAAQPPELLEQERGRDDGRPRVEGEAVLPVNVSPAARRVEPLQDGHPVAARTQPHGRGQAAEAAADHDGMGRALGQGTRHSRTVNTD
jgi:hypothetical protein